MSFRDLLVQSFEARHPDWETYVIPMRKFVPRAQRVVVPEVVVQEAIEAPEVKEVVVQPIKEEVPVVSNSQVLEIESDSEDTVVGEDTVIQKSFDLEDSAVVAFVYKKLDGKEIQVESFEKDDRPAFIATATVEVSGVDYRFRAEAETKKSAVFEAKKRACVLIDFIASDGKEEDFPSSRKVKCDICGYNVNPIGHESRCNDKPGVRTKDCQYDAFLGDRLLGMHWGLILENHEGGYRIQGSKFKSVGAVISHFETAVNHRFFLKLHEEIRDKYYLTENMNDHTWSTAFEHYYWNNPCSRRDYWKYVLKDEFWKFQNHQVQIEKPI
jgi:hypothetical protein